MDDRGQRVRRVAVITGGASGLGAATTRQLRREGVAVAVWDNSEQNLASLRAELAPDPDLFLHQTDVTDPAAVREALAATHAALGPVAILVACAGGGAGGGIRSCIDYPLEEWRAILELNLTSAHLCCQAVLHDMLDAGWGRIVLVSSMAGKEGNIGQLAYSAAKAGLFGYVKSMGKELGPTGVIVNGITPTIFDTPMFRAGNDAVNDALRQQIIPKIPMGRLGKPEEFAALASWLVSDACSFTTGVMFDLSGGRSTY